MHEDRPGVGAAYKLRDPVTLDWTWRFEDLKTMAHWGKARGGSHKRSTFTAAAPGSRFLPGFRA